MQQHISPIKSISNLRSKAFYLFLLPRRTINTFNAESFIALVTATIQNGHRNHTVIVAEEASHRMEDALERTIDAISAFRCEHQVHAFILASEAFKEFSEENKVHFMEQYILETLTDDWQNLTEIQEAVALKMRVNAETLTDLVPYYMDRMLRDRMLESNSDSDDNGYFYVCRRLQNENHV